MQYEFVTDQAIRQPPIDLGSVVATAKEPNKGPNLNYSLVTSRGLKDQIFTTFIWAMGALAVIPLISVLYMLAVEGGSRLNFETLTALPPTAFEFGGGFGNAIMGTLTMVAIAAAISVPFGIMIAVYISELAPNSKFAKVTEFLSKVLTGMPSILAGVFAYSVVVVTTGTYSAWAGGIALAVLMMPTVILTTKEAFKSVPNKIREAAFGMGCTRGQAVWRVMLPTAGSSVVTGVLLAVAGAAGESAPLLFTALFSNYYAEGLAEPTASLSILIYNFSGSPFANQIELAWAASLVLVMMVLVINLVARLLSRRKHIQ